MDVHSRRSEALSVISSKDAPLNKVPEVRVRPVNGAPINAKGGFVLYWMNAHRRTNSNFSLQRAIEWARTLKRPLVVLEALRCDYPWASERLHRFIIDGMIDNREHLAGSPVWYYPYVEQRKGEGKGLLESFGALSCIVVTDDFPCFFLPRMLAAAGQRLPVRLEAVDSNGLLPVRAAQRVFVTAFSFRRFLQKHLADHLDCFPQMDPITGMGLPRLGALPQDLVKRWPPASKEFMKPGSLALTQLPLDHKVSACTISGGSIASKRVLSRFVHTHLDLYHTSGNHPDDNATSGLSPYLHFGHLSSHEAFTAIAEHEDWTKDDLAPKSTGGRLGWWGMSEGAESFLDQLITWRELGFNMCSMRQDYDQFGSLPQWAQDTLCTHGRDPRQYTYTKDEFESAKTHDPLWNAAQTQLLKEGRIHNYLRMLWGKKILQWSASPREALAVMVELNDKYALDGRDPNSYSGIFWVLGRYDRPWGPERQIFGKIRYMSSKRTHRKVRVVKYVKRYGVPE